MSLWPNFDAIAHAAARYTSEYVLEDVPSRELPEWGEPGVVVLVDRCRGQLKRMVAYYAKGERSEFADLENAAILGFITALQNYDPARGADPMTYAYHSVRRELQAACRLAVAKTLPDRQHERFWAAMDACDNVPEKARRWAELQCMGGQALQDLADAGDGMASDIITARIARWERKGQDVADMMAADGDDIDRGLSPAVFDDIYSALHYTSIDAALTDPEGNAVAVADSVGDPSAQTAYVDVENRAAIARMLHVLDDRERDIIAGLYGLDGSEVPAIELAERHGISRPRVLNIRAAALRKLAAVA